MTMELRLPPEKFKKIRAVSRKLLEAGQVSACALSRLIGAANQVIPQALLFYRHLQMDLARALRTSDQDYDSTLTLSLDSREELLWWDNQMIKWNGKTILTTEPDLIIESDASNQGCGASCQGTNTGGPWSTQEKTRHINCLELLAATKPLWRPGKGYQYTTYINNHGRTVSKELVSLTRDLWMWCLERNIHIQAQYLPGILNHSADMESRSMKDRSDWKLDRQTFVKINEHYGPLEVDLFASRLTNQCRRYFSWWPDLFAKAFLQDWTIWRGYANPPWNLISRVLRKTHTYKGQRWYLWPQEGPAVVHSPSINASRLAMPPTQVTDRDTGGVRSANPTVSRMEYLRERLNCQGLSYQATDLILKSWRTKTNRSYDSLFGRWNCWCGERGSDPFGS